MKEILKTLVGLVIILGLISKVKSGDIHLPKFVSNALGVKRMLDGDTIYIQGVGNYSNSVLINAKQIVEETYGVPAKIIEPIQLTSDYYVNNSIDCHKCIYDFDDNKNKILLTNEVCLTSKDNIYVNGLGEMNGNILIVNEKNYIGLKRVIIHEIGHNSGLHHCENKNCVMSIDRNDEIHTMYFCDECKKSL
jgi:predicted Zn-dependent protease